MNEYTDRSLNNEDLSPKNSNQMKTENISKRNLGLGDFPLEIILKIISYLQGWDKVMFCSTCSRFRELLLSSGPIWKQRDLAIPLSVNIGQYSKLFCQIMDLTVVLTTDNFTSGISVHVPMKQRRNARDLPFFTSLFPDLTNAKIEIVHVYLAVKFGQHVMLRFLWSFVFDSQLVIYPLYIDKNRHEKKRQAHKVQKE